MVIGDGMDMKFGNEQEWFVFAIFKCISAPL